MVTTVGDEGEEVVGFWRSTGGGCAVLAVAADQSYR